MDFNTLPQPEPGLTPNPYAARTEDGQWIQGYVRVEFLNTHFGHLSTASQMKAATTSEGLKLYFDWLSEQGKLPE